MTSRERPSTIDDALKILDEALIKQQLPDLSPLLSDELNGTVNAIKSKISETGLSEFKDLQAGFQQAKQIGTELTKDLSADLNKRIQENPWPIIGGIAIGAAAFGFLLGQRNSKS